MKTYPKYRLFTLAILCSLTLMGNGNLMAQQDSSRTAQIKNFISTLKNGALLVRLQDRSKGIKTMQDAGYAEKAEEVKREQYRENKEIILSFQQTFDFCPVYFFYAKDSEAIRNQKFKGRLFNAQLEPVKNTDFGSDFYTAEFSETKNLGIDGLVIMDQNLIPLKAPLPHYERRYTWLGMVSRSKADMAKEYNEKLHQLYERYF